MAVRFDATGDGLVRTANLPSRTAFYRDGLVQDYDGPERV